MTAKIGLKITNLIKNRNLGENVSTNVSGRLLHGSWERDRRQYFAGALYRVGCAVKRSLVRDQGSCGPVSEL